MSRVSPRGRDQPGRNGAPGVSPADWPATQCQCRGGIGLTHSTGRPRLCRPGTDTGMPRHQLKKPQKTIAKASTTAQHCQPWQWLDSICGGSNWQPRGLSDGWTDRARWKPNLQLVNLEDRQAYSDKCLPHHKHEHTYTVYRSQDVHAKRSFSQDFYYFSFIKLLL